MRIGNVHLDSEVGYALLSQIEKICPRTEHITNCSIMIIIEREGLSVSDIETEKKCFCSSPPKITVIKVGDDQCSYLLHVVIDNATTSEPWFSLELWGLATSTLNQKWDIQSFQKLWKIYPKYATLNALIPSSNTAVRTSNLSWNIISARSPVWTSLYNHTVIFTISLNACVIIFRLL